ncbi:hypothetical protein BV22DRAFT_1034416 [Leucogyrophana mollusca]|uniref:Uncharacterized protein n=1 Tax=Leucogyrophana mollusca TaxID=85980 RepID=A0ACB8BIG7_9AGAM|nr:hypothetical protein BV22DRAFT_1034416 [Leucogyrophana mollusca]
MPGVEAQSQAGFSILFPMSVEADNQLVALDLEGQRTDNYATLAATTVLIWDAILTISAERRYIGRKSTPLKLAFAINRYGTVIMMSLFLWSIMPIPSLSTKFCQSVLPIEGILFFTAESTGNMLTVYRIFVLWNHSPKIMKRLLVGGITVLAIGAPFVGVRLMVLHKGSLWEESVHSCLGVDRSLYFMAFSLSQTSFDVYAACLAFCNSLDIPRTSNRQLWTLLRKDGVLLIISVVLLRIFGIALGSRRNSVYTFLGTSVVSALIATLNARLVLTVCEAEYARLGDEDSEDQDWMLEDPEERRGSGHPRESENTSAVGCTAAEQNWCLPEIRVDVGVSSTWH